MQSYTLNTKTWHFYLASNWGKHIYIDDGPMDICTYIRRVIAGALKFTMATLIMCFLAGALLAVEGSFLFTAYAIMIHNLSLVGERVFACAFIGALINILILIVAVKTYYDNHHCKISIPTPGFVSLAARKFKSKTCFMVEFKE